MNSYAFIVSLIQHSVNAESDIISASKQTNLKGNYKGACSPVRVEGFGPPLI